MKNITASILLLALAGCGGSNEDDSASSSVADNAGTVTGSGNEFNPGGTPSNPGPVSFIKKNEINVDAFENYFTINLEKDSKLYISALLDLGMKTLDKTRCVSSTVEESGFITVDSIGVACDHRVVLDLKAGQHSIHFEYPNSNYGYFTVDTIENNQRTILNENGSGGLPSTPRKISFTENNEINKDLNNNYFVYEGKAGDKLFLNSYLQESIPALMLTRCRSGAGEDRSAIGFSINEGAYSCTENLEYELPEDGTYFFHVFYMAPSDVTYPVPGYFRADIQYAQ
ncbi:hypothetical protein [Pseudoalteromonas sp. NZS11_1]|uniref:hypothetical protein n=1 Tax=Pseudoalteromonas sp. NZS11_1 TaxID=2792070 RepID=UPI0018CE070D|nr:hypothetical protein [Pseudoalteromonas sp. NZS11_1]MBH0045233.1 hypothetical protein [Pseudoalteromonas sp. NZS11_1]